MKIEGKNLTERETSILKPLTKKEELTREEAQKLLLGKYDKNRDGKVWYYDDYETYCHVRFEDSPEGQSHGKTAKCYDEFQEAQTLSQRLRREIEIVNKLKKIDFEKPVQLTYELNPILSCMNPGEAARCDIEKRLLGNPDDVKKPQRKQIKRELISNQTENNEILVSIKKMLPAWEISADAIGSGLYHGHYTAKGKVAIQQGEISLSTYVVVDVNGVIHTHDSSVSDLLVNLRIAAKKTDGNYILLEETH